VVKSDVSKLDSIEGKKIHFSLWHNLVCSLKLAFLSPLVKTIIDVLT